MHWYWYCTDAPSPSPYMRKHVSNLPADTFLRKICSRCPIGKLHVGKYMQQTHGVIDVGTGYRDWLWLFFFAVNSNAETKCTNCLNQEDYPYSDPALQTFSSRIQHVKCKKGLEYLGMQALCNFSQQQIQTFVFLWIAFRTRTRMTKLAYQLETPTELSTFCCGNLVSPDFRFAKLNLTCLFIKEMPISLTMNFKFTNWAMKKKLHVRSKIYTIRLYLLLWQIGFALN